MEPAYWDEPWPVRRRTGRQRAVVWTRRLAPFVVVAAVVEWWLLGDPTDHVAHAGEVAVPVQAVRNPMRAVGGVGFGPRLALVGDGWCLGTSDGTEELVVVWPAGTDVHGEGQDLSVTNGGRTWRLGDSVEAGPTTPTRSVRRTAGPASATTSPRSAATCR